MLRTWVPLNHDKTIEPTTNLSFLCLEIDTQGYKSKNLNICYSFELQKKKENIRLSQLETLVAKLDFVFGKAIPEVRSLPKRFFNSLSDYLHVNAFVYFPNSDLDTSDILQLYTKNAGSSHLSCYSFFQGQLVHVSSSYL